MKIEITEFNDIYRFQNYINKIGTPIQLYLDSRDILHMILGIKALTTHNLFDSKELYSEEILIRGLIFNKWLGSFEVLLPHEDEILYNINRFKSTIDDVNEEEAGEIWYNVTQITGIKFEDLLDKKPIDVYNILKSKNNAQQVYVAKYLLEKPNWKERIQYLYNNVYSSDPEIPDFNTCLHTKLFNTLMDKGFFKQRPHSKEANIVDSLVLCSIKNKLEKYKNNQINNKLPVFYDSTGLFRKVIKIAKLEEEFYYKYDGQNFISVLQGNDFFLLLSVLKELDKSDPIISNESISDYNNLKQVIQKINIKIEELQKIDKIHIEELKQFINTKFIKVFWINEQSDSIEFIENLVKQLKKKEVVEKVNNDLEVLIKDIKERVAQYSIFRELFSSLYFSYHNIKSIFTEHIENYDKIDSKLDIFKDYGLTRFSINSTKNCRELQDLIDDIFTHKENDKNLYTVQLFKIGKSLSQSYSDANNVDQDNLIIGIALLWILGKANLIVEILLKVVYSPTNYCLAFFHAASLLKTKDCPENIEDIEKILNKVNNSNPKYCFKNNYKTAIAASYIYYHIWEKNCVSNFRKDLDINNFQIDLQNENNYFTLACDYALVAINFLRKDQKFKEKEYRKTKYYYIINNYIYYITMGGSKTKFDNLINYINEIKEIYTNYPQYWQYRFDDTLSLYYLRLAVTLENNVALAKEYLKTALNWSNKAEKLVLLLEDKKIIEQTRMKIIESMAKLKE